MVCPSESLRRDPDPELIQPFRDGLGLPDDCRVDCDEDRLWVLFTESDFLIQSGPGDDDNTVHLTFTVTVRAPAPSLETWWDKWTVTAGRDHQFEVARQEVINGRNMILRMLDDRFGIGRSGRDLSR